MMLLGCKASSQELKQWFQQSSVGKDILEPCFKGEHEHRAEEKIESVIS